MIFVCILRCVNVTDDPFRPCFGCETAAPRNSDERNENFFDFEDDSFEYVDRQTREVFRVTSQRRRLICRRSATAGRQCVIRVSRAVELRSRNYIQALRFIQAEQYLSEDDVDILRFFQILFS